MCVMVALSFKLPRIKHFYQFSNEVDEQQIQEKDT